MSPLEVWGGVECTVNRVGEAFHNQLRANGHERRISDLDLFAELGLRSLRYPVLWELCAPESPDRIDWSWPDARLARLQELGIDPIVGLLHHGSGPRYTNLLDERFPELFADYARAVAERFPSVQRYTPINEPLTTARFSALYGHWYPHHRDDRSFVRALLNECRATVLAMRAIRGVNPNAQLIQTDDLGRTTSTPKLAYQAEFQNERRWLAWDLLCGHIEPQHALWRYLLRSGATPSELAWFRSNPCPPDVIGINHYLTSDRHLDETLTHLTDCWGGNGRDAYADIEAVRVLPHSVAGIAGALQDTWQRYRIPVAITEAHLGCTREEQLRWLAQIWQSAQKMRAAGADIRAVTIWALLGSFDWDSLVTRQNGHYEPGAFDVRGETPRPTALARLTKELAFSMDPYHAQLIESPGWWERPSRLLTEQLEPPPTFSRRTRPTKRRTVLITGARGTLGSAFHRICDVRGLDTRICTRAELDICDAHAVARVIEDSQPWIVVNTAGYVRVDDAERECDRCYRENAEGAELLARACAQRSVSFVTFSSDLVFDGQRSEPYLESHEAAPLNVYGLSKLRAERAVLKEHPNALVIRTSSFFGPWDDYNFLSIALRRLRAGEDFIAMNDVVVSPTYVPDLVNASLDLIIDGERGIWHLANRGSLTWLQLAHRAAKLANVSTERLEGRSWRELNLAAPRPLFTALGSERGLVMPTLDNALERYIAAA
jgi:dTDP-4-dehydrorhamnose reductase